jgi:hypothetical protein
MGRKRTTELAAVVSLSAAICAVLLLAIGRGDRTNRVLLQRNGAAPSAGQSALATSIQQALDDEENEVAAVHPENTGELQAVKWTAEIATFQCVPVYEQLGPIQTTSVPFPH